MEKIDDEILLKAELSDATIKRLHEIGYFEAPASKGHHLAKPGGLFEHSKNVASNLRMMQVFASDAASYRVGLLHDVVKCYCYKRVGDVYEYVQPPYPGHGVASVMIAFEIGVALSPAEIAAITWHMGVFGLDGRQLKEYDAACRRFPVEVILTHAADHLASKMEEAAADDCC